MEIRLTAYQTIQGEAFREKVIIKITPDIFNNTEPREGRFLFTFKDCFFKEILIVNESEINFSDISFSFSFCLIQNFKVDNQLVTDKLNFHFHGSIISGNINHTKIESVSLNNCIIQSLFLLNLKQVNVSYTEENIFLKKWQNLLGKTDVDNIEELLKLKQSIYIHHCQHTSVRFNHSKDDKYGVYRAEYEQLNEYKVRYHLKKREKHLLNITLAIQFSEKNKSTKIENALLNTLSLKGNVNGEFSIENSKVNQLFIREFNSNSNTLFYNLRPYLDNSKIEIHKSNMDNSWFDNIEFINYKILSFYRSRFAKATFTSCNFPTTSLSFEKFKSLENVHYPNNKTQNYYKDQYEVFLQLRSSLKETGNYFEAQKLGAISKEALRKVNGLPTSDKLILWLNKISNNHGLSIKRAFICFMISSIILYVFYLLSIGRIFIDSDIDFSLVGYYFYFIDITHKKDFLVDQSQFSFWSLLIDFLNKIIVGFFAFQFISAFRKYVKK